MGAYSKQLRDISHPQHYQSHDGPSEIGDLTKGDIGGS